ncbi:MAG: TadE/TadG family type IV pilus assembly protein [Chloroflexota bacterium]
MRTSKITSGQSLVEFALLFPLLFLLVMGLFDIGRAIFYYSTLNTAVREGTRYAIVQSDCDYKLDPGACSGGYLDSYPLDCKNANSTANIKICNEITNKFFSIGDLSSSMITINHTVSFTDDPEINIGIDFLFKPVTPGLALIEDFPMHVNSQMLMTPIAEP